MEEGQGAVDRIKKSISQLAAPVADGIKFNRARVSLPLLSNELQHPFALCHWVGVSFCSFTIFERVELRVGLGGAPRSERRITTISTCPTYLFYFGLSTS